MVGDWIPYFQKLSYGQIYPDFQSSTGSVNLNISEIFNWKGIVLKYKLL